jgi:hypothetical protein
MRLKPRFSSLMTVMALCLVGATPACGNVKVNTALEAAQVATESAQATFTMLSAAASSMIPMLPLDQQAARRDELTQIVLKGDQVFQAANDAIRSARTANAETFNAGQFVTAIAAVMEDLMRLSTAVGVRSDVVAHAKARVAVLKASQ